MLSHARRRRGQGGAAALFAVWLMGLLLTGGVGGIDAAAAIAAQSRAENAADATAHAAAGLLAEEPDREQLSLAVQAGVACDTEAPSSSAAAAGPACGRAVSVARRVAAENDAILVRLTVGPDLRDETADRGPGRVLTLVEVAVPRRLPVLPAWCPPRPGSTSDLCWVETWSGAQEAG